MASCTEDRRATPGLKEGLARVLSAWVERRAPDRDLPMTPGTGHLLLALALAALLSAAVSAGVFMLLARASGKAFWQRSPSTQAVGATNPVSPESSYIQRPLAGAGAPTPSSASSAPR